MMFLIAWGVLSVAAVGFMYCCSVVSNNTDFREE